LRSSYTYPQLGKKFHQFYWTNSYYIISNRVFYRSTLTGPRLSYLVYRKNCTSGSGHVPWMTSLQSPKFSSTFLYGAGECSPKHPLAAVGKIKEAA